MNQTHVCFFAIYGVFASLLQELWVSYHITKCLIISWMSQAFLSGPMTIILPESLSSWAFGFTKCHSKWPQRDKNISLLFCACCSKGLTQWLQKAHLSVAKAGGSVHWGTWITQAKIFKYPCLGTIFLSQQLHLSSLFVRFLERLRLFNVQWASHSKINSEMLICVSPTF